MMKQALKVYAQDDSRGHRAIKNSAVVSYLSSNDQSLQSLAKSAVEIKRTKNQYPTYLIHI